MSRRSLMSVAMLMTVTALAPLSAPAQTPEVVVLRSGHMARVSATGAVQTVGLEVYSRRGDKLFDSKTVPGASLDWPLVDVAGRPLADGTYYYTLTLTYESGFTVRQLGRVALRWDRALLRPQFIERVGPTGEVLAQAALEEKDGPVSATSGGLFQLDVSDSRTGGGLPLLSFRNPLPAPAFTSAGGRAIVARGAGANQGGGALVAQFGNGAVLGESRQALLAHDGTDGRLVIRGGALRLSTGNLFDGSDVERLRLTASGNVGIGTLTPGSRLTVAGVIESTTGGFKFPDGSTQTSAVTNALSAVAHDATLTGTGTTGAPLGLATGGVGTPHLADSAVTGAKIAAG